MPQKISVSSAELRARIKRLGITYADAAERLGLSLSGLNLQMRGVRPVSRQTTLLLEVLERDLRRTRTAQGGSRAKAQGEHMGRPPSSTQAQQRRPPHGVRRALRCRN